MSIITYKASSHCVQCLPDTQPPNPVCQSSQFDLQRSRLICHLQRRQDPPMRRESANIGNQVSSNTFKNSTSRNDKRITFPCRGSIFDSPPDLLSGCLFHLIRFAGCRGFIAFDAVSRNQYTICGRRVTGFKM